MVNQKLFEGELKIGCTWVCYKDFVCEDAQFKDSEKNESLCHFFKMVRMMDGNLKLVGPCGDYMVANTPQPTQ